MNPLELLRRAQAMGLDLDVDGERLLIWPEDKVTPDLLDDLRAHKPELIQWLSTHHRRGWGTVPPDDLELNPVMPRPAPQDRERVIAFAFQQCHASMLRWIVRRESDYFDGPGGRWDCALHAYAAARDLACWQLGINECEAIRFIQDMDDVARSMREER